MGLILKKKISHSLSLVECVNWPKAIFVSKFLCQQILLTKHRAQTPVVYLAGMEFKNNLCISFWYLFEGKSTKKKKGKLRGYFMWAIFFPTFRF